MQPGVFTSADPDPGGHIPDLQRLDVAQRQEFVASRRPGIGWPARQLNGRDRLEQELMQSLPPRRRGDAWLSDKARERVGTQIDLIMQVPQRIAHRLLKISVHLAAHPLLPQRFRPSPSSLHPSASGRSSSLARFLPEVNQRTTTVPLAMPAISWPFPGYFLAQNPFKCGANESTLVM
jgi:hypothetical protein